MALPKTSKLALVTLAALVLAACGGGDSGTVSSSSGYTVESGVAQKGPLAQGSAIWVNELAATTYKPNGKEYTFRTTNDFGTFTPSGVTYGTPYLSTLAQGYYYNEITGTQSDDVVLLSGLSQIGAEGSTAADTAINLNVLSSMAVNRVTKLATTAPTRTFSVARAKAQKETLGALYIYNDATILSGKKVGGVAQPANLTALDLSKSRAADQILAAASAVVMKAGVNGAGVNALLSQTASDLEDDGLLNNSTNYRTSVQSKLCAAAAVTDFATVATNLNSLYGTSYSATDLSQWVDTSGCVDQVINKYKFSAINVAVGTVNKSPVYTVGADDVGQCFSVGGVTTGATSGLYHNGSTTAVVGTQLVKAGDSVTIGLNPSAPGAYSGFIERSAPAANGTCPTVVPLNGLTRAAKYTTYSGYTLGGTVTGLTAGQSVTLRNNGGSALTITANGSFAFSNTLFDGAGYSVTALTQYSKTCTVANGTGTATANVSDVVVSCSGPISYVVSTLAGTGVEGSEDGTGDNASFGVPMGVAVDTGGNVYVADRQYRKIRKITSAGVVTTLAGSGNWDSTDGTGASASFKNPRGVAVDASGNVYVADTDSYTIRKITSAGVVTTLAGSAGVPGRLNGTGAAARFWLPSGVAVDASGNVYVADYYSIRKITSAGVVTTLAGNQESPGSTDGTGGAATFNNYLGAVAVDASGNVYVADSDNLTVRKITSARVVTTLAGSAGVYGSTDGTGGTASFSHLYGIAVDASGNVYVADSDNLKIRKITSAGVVSTVAGTGAKGSLDGAGATATFGGMWGVSADANGNLYVADYRNKKIRKLTPQ